MCKKGDIKDKMVASLLILELDPGKVGFSIQNKISHLQRKLKTYKIELKILYVHHKFIYFETYQISFSLNLFIYTKDTINTKAKKFQVKKRTIMLNS